MVGNHYNSESVDLMFPRQIYTAGQITQPTMYCFSGQRVFNSLNIATGNVFDIEQLWVLKPVHATLDPQDYSFHPHTWMKKFKV